VAGLGLPADLAKQLAGYSRRFWYDFQMRRLFAIFLLVLLPLQLSWAAVGVYCQHETGAAAKHLGHHDHQHKTDASHGDQADPKTSGGIDNDCGACHASCCVAIFGEIQVSAPTDTSTDVVDYRHSLNTSPHYQPERPNWAPLA
jgi:hypothetical protein